MRKLVLGALTVALVSCGKSEPVDYALFEGTIKNPNSENLTIYDNENTPIKEIKVSAEGVFSDTIFNAKGNYRFSDGKESSALYLKDGFAVKLNMDAKEFDETIVYSGEGSIPNNFLAQKYLIKEKSGTTKELYSLGEAEYLEKKKLEKEALTKSLKDLKGEFLEQEKANLDYDYISHLMRYEDAHSYFTKKEDFKVSESFPNVFENLDLSNEEAYKNSPVYKDIVNYNFRYTARKKSEGSDVSYETALINLLKETKSKIIKDDFIKSLSRQVAITNPNAEELYKGILEVTNDEALKNRLTNQFNAIQKLAKGKASPIFENYENNAGGTTSLSDLKGKYVYVDVWATWCGPCKDEIPFLKKVEEKYHDKNIHFVSISVDVKRDYETWKEMIKEKELTGIQLMSDNDWKSSFVKGYQIQGIPRFILIDPEGNIVNASAPRPSSKKLIELFDELKI